MAAVASVAAECGSYCLDGGVECGGSRFLYVATGRQRVRRQAQVMLALTDPVERAAGDEVAAQTIIAALRDQIDGLDPDSVIEALHAAFGAANRWLLGQNRAHAGRRKVFLGLTCVVRSGDDLFIAQVPPGQALIRQDDALFAFPRLRSWSPAFQPSRTYELPNPLGLRELTEPQVYYSRVASGDLLAALSSSIAARLEPFEEEIRDAAGADDVIDTARDVCERHGIARGEAGVIMI